MDSWESWVSVIGSLASIAGANWAYFEANKDKKQLAFAPTSLILVNNFFAS